LLVGRLEKRRLSEGSFGGRVSGVPDIWLDVFQFDQELDIAGCDFAILNVEVMSKGPAFGLFDVLELRVAVVIEV